MSARSLPERCYRVLLRIAPAAFRETHGDEATTVFGELYREHLEAKGRVAAFGLCIRCVLALFRCVAAERFDEFRGSRKRLAEHRNESSRRGGVPVGRGRGIKRAPEHLKQDLLFAFRGAIRNPGFTLAVVLILGVGIGATTAIFSAVDTVMLRPLPYPDPDRLVSAGYSEMRPLLYRRWGSELSSFSAIAASWNTPADLVGDGPPERLRAARVTPSLLAMLGATPQVGRLLVPEDFSGRQDVVILGHGFWQRRWGGDPAVVGRTLNIGGKPVVVAGVIGLGFEPPEAVTGRRVDVWMPLDIEDEQIQGWSILSVIGRLRPGVGLAAAQQESNTITEHLAAELPDILVRRDGTVQHTSLLPLRIATVRSVIGPFFLLTCAVLLMLLIACANVANLLLARGTARAQEIAVRGAIGASRGRIVVQLLTESVSLSVAGGVLGVLLAVAGVRAFVRFGSVGFPRIHELAVDQRILVFAVALSMTTGILFGLLPAIQAARKDVVDSLRQGAVGLSQPRRRRRNRNTLVTVEIATALFLLTGAGLFIRSLGELSVADPGFEPENLFAIPLPMESPYTDADRLHAVHAISERIMSIRGTEGVTAGLTVPFQYLGAGRCCITNEVLAQNTPEEAEPLSVWIHPVTSGYFRTLGAPLSYGKEFEASDGQGDQRVAILNEPTALRLFGTADAVGQSISIGNEGSFTVVGVERGVPHWGIPNAIPLAVYVPWDSWGKFSSILQLLVRSNADLPILAQSVRDAVWSVDPDLPVEEIIPMSDRVAASMAGHRLMSLLLGTFAAVALVLACSGVYATMLYSVGQRRHEIGVRLALGARGVNVVALVLKSGLALTGLGIAVGVLGSLGLSRLLHSMLWGVSAADPVTLAGTTLVLVVVALGACLVPALKAARTDPLSTLKLE